MHKTTFEPLKKGENLLCEKKIERSVFFLDIFKTVGYKAGF